MTRQPAWWIPTMSAKIKKSEETTAHYCAEALECPYPIIKR